MPHWHSVQNAVLTLAVPGFHLLLGQTGKQGICVYARPASISRALGRARFLEQYFLLASRRTEGLRSPEALSWAFSRFCSWGGAVADNPKSRRAGLADIRLLKFEEPVEVIGVESLSFTLLSVTTLGEARSV